MKPQKNIWLGTVAWTLLTLVCLGNLGLAAEKNSADPTGTWKIATISTETKKPGPGAPMKLKLEGGKVTGSITHKSSINGTIRDTERLLKDGKLQGDMIWFTVNFPPVSGDGPEVTQSYGGKITGDTMKGTMDIEWNGTTRTRDWEAKRVKE